MKTMRKSLIIISILLMSALIFSACSKQVQEEDKSIETDKSNSVDNESTNTEATDASEETETSKEDVSSAENVTSETFLYESEEGPISVPSDPNRIIVLNSFVSGSVMAFDTDIVGADSWAMANPRYAEFLENAVEVTDESLEKILELEPDLIIAAPTNNNIDKLKQIAPTIVYTYGKLDYLTQILEVGKLLNKEQEAKAWIDDFKERAKTAGEEIKAVIGADATVVVMESFEKQLYVFGDNWGRGTEIIYQEMKLNMPEKVKEMALEAGYYALSPEVLPEYAGDYIIFSKNSAADNSFQETDTYNNIAAVKNNRVFEYDASEFYFNDPITLDYQLSAFTNNLLGNE